MAGFRSELGEAALELAAAGHPVLPLHSPFAGGCTCGNRRCSRVGKHPRGVYGLTHASTDPEQVESWWYGQPSANVGMRCDGLVVFDLDGPKGKRSFEQLEWELGELPESRTQQSGRGEHRFYRIPAESSIGNSTAALDNPPGLDLRAGTRGYVVVAPSLHASGARYVWDPETPFAFLLQPWLERLLELPSLPERQPARRGCGGNQLDEIRRLALGGESTRYGLVALEAHLEKIRTAPEGKRNETLNRSVFRLAQLVAGGELALEQVEREATAAALANGLDWLETDLTIASAISAGWAYPRSRKPRP
jgi:hypothetical protein